MFGSKILYDEYYGYDNTGDDAFIEVVAWATEIMWNKKEFRFLGINLPTTQNIAKGYPVRIPKSYDLQRKILMDSAKYFISAGGSTFNRVKQGSNKWVASKIRENKGVLKLGAVGVSIGPFSSVQEENEIKKYLSNLDFLAVRDNASYEYLTSLNLPYKPINAFDLAALLPQVYQKADSTSILLEDQKNKKIIGISICNYESYLKNGEIGNEIRRNHFIDELIKMLDSSGNYKFRFFILNGNQYNGDQALTYRTIKNTAPKDFEIFPYNRETKSTWDAISECDAMLCTRLHAGIFACFTHVPFFLIEYHRKCSDFLNDIGQADKYRLYDAEVDLKETTETILNVLEKNSYLEPTNIYEMQEKAELNFKCIKLNLSE